MSRQILKYTNLEHTVLALFEITKHTACSGKSEKIIHFDTIFVRLFLLARFGKNLKIGKM